MTCVHCARSDGRQAGKSHAYKCSTIPAPASGAGRLVCFTLVWVGPCCPTNPGRRPGRRPRVPRHADHSDPLETPQGWLEAMAPVQVIKTGSGTNQMLGHSASPDLVSFPNTKSRTGMCTRRPGGWPANLASTTGMMEVRVYIQTRTTSPSKEHKNAPMRRSCITLSSPTVSQQL
jgi:hypothetical protein